MFNLSYQDLQMYIIFSGILFTLIIYLYSRNYNKLVDRIEELEKQGEE